MPPSLDNQRTDYFYASLHLDYDVANTHHFYPLIELNWFHYTSDGGGGHPSTFGFEGRDLINFGSKGVSGHDEVSLAFGARFKYNEMIQFGGALEFPLSGTKDLLDFRLTLDVIFRY